ncbi:MAG: F0F1 ATP synthase subunit B [Calditrichaeota bacterium]|nr:F0F1 ATP synthase subunit B [Calditrichota bacterium]
MSLLTPALGTLFWTGLTFLLLLLILKKMAWGPILQMLDERETRIKESLEKADAAQKETEAALAKNQEIMEQARKEAREMLSASRRTADTTKQEIVERAEAEAARTLEKAKREIGLEREKAVEEIRSQTAELSVLIASKLIDKTLSVEDHKEIIDRSLQKMVDAN